MKRKRHTIEAIMRILREAETGKAIGDVCRDHAISEQTFSRWRRKYAEMELSDAKRLKALEEENRRLKGLVADQALNIEVLKEVNSKKW